MSTAPRIQLALSIDADADEALVKSVAEAAGMTAYDVRLRLKPGLPKPLKCCNTVEAAEQLAAKLRPLGAVTIVYPQDSLPPAEPVAALGLDRTRSSLRFKTRRDDVEVPHDEIALMVYGKCLVSSEKKEIKKPVIITTSGVVGIGVPMALSGGMSVSKHQTETEFFLYIFRREPLCPAIEVRQGSFQYDCLGKHRGMSDAENHNLLVGGLRRLLPHVPFNDWLLDGQSTNRGDGYYNRRRAPDAGLPNATLIHWRLHAVASGGHFAVTGGPGQQTK